MNFKDILDTDLEGLRQYFLRALRWWLDELSQMVPAEWRERFLVRTQTFAEVRDGAILYRDARDGTEQAARPRGAVKLAIEPRNVLTREIDLPLLPLSDVKRMLALDIDRLTPFHADQVLFDAEVVAKDQDGGRQTVLLGVFPRASAAKLMERVRANNLHPTAIGVLRDREGGRTSFDFLPALREAEGGGAARKRAAYLWAGAAALLLFNLLLLGYRDSNALDQLRETVNSQQAPVNVAMRLRDKVSREASRRVALMNLKAQNSPLKMIDAVTRALPNDAWVQRFEWNGKTVHVTGFKKTTPDLLARLEASPELHNARSLSSEPRGTNPSGQPFDLAAEVLQEHRP